MWVIPNSDGLQPRHLRLVFLDQLRTANRWFPLRVFILVFIYVHRTHSKLKAFCSSHPKGVNKHFHIW